MAMREHEPWFQVGEDVPKIKGPSNRQLVTRVGWNPNSDAAKEHQERVQANFHSQAEVQELKQNSLDGTLLQLKDAVQKLHERVSVLEVHLNGGVKE